MWWRATGLVVLAACAKTHPYPASWPPPAAVHGCAPIAGTYANDGETSIHESTATVYLSQILQFEGWGADYENPENVARVRLEGPRDHRLTIELLSDGGRRIRTIVYSESAGDYSCTKDGLRRSTGPNFRLMLGTDSATVHLVTNSAGDLVVKRTETIVGLLPLPDYTTYEDYVRFERLPE